MKRFVAILLASAAVTGCGQLGEPVAIIECAETQTECINTWFDAKFDEMLAFSPMMQTSLGIKTDYGKIDDMSVEAEQARLEWWQQATAEMEANFDYDELDTDAKLSWDMWQFRKNEAETAAKYRDQQYILHQMGTAHSGLPTFLMNQHKVDDESDMVAFVARLGGIGTALDQLLKRAKANAEAGTRPPQFAYDAVIAESKKITTGAPFSDGDPSALWNATEERIAKLTQGGTITQERAGELREEARTCAHRSACPRLCADRRMVHHGSRKC